MRILFILALLVGCTPNSVEPIRQLVEADSSVEMAPVPMDEIIIIDETAADNDPWLEIYMMHQLLLY